MKVDQENSHIKFSYNRTYNANQEYPSGGSWSKSMRPDYTLSLWPSEFSEKDAEDQELILHLHFDAKYKVRWITDIFGPENQSEEDLDKEILEQDNGVYVRADLLKMHAYKDAVRRTAGAYVLYPGNNRLNQKRFSRNYSGS